VNFYNPHVIKTRRRFLDLILWMVGYYRDPPPQRPEAGFSYPLPDQTFDPNRPWAQWINHSTYLVSFEGSHFLTDPIWSKRCSPVSFLGPKRKHPPALSMEKLPKIDYVLISHDHYDHLDKKSVEKLHQLFPNLLWVVPHGVKKWFKSRGIERVVELEWWQHVDIDSFRITAVPSQHFSGRVHFNKTVWAGYVVESLHKEQRFYFVGDTGYNPYDFKTIGEKWKSFDLALIPIGAYSPRVFMGPVHICPSEAVQIHKEVGSNLSLGMHWKTFRLADEPMDQPPYDLFRALHEAKVDPATFLAIDPGVRRNW